MSSIPDTLANLASGRLTATDLVRSSLDSALVAGVELNCILHSLEDSAIAQAAESGGRWESGSARALEGVPFTVKDGIWVDGAPSADGSLSRVQFVSPRNSPVVERLRRAGAIPVAKTTQPEFGLPGITRGRLFGVTGNHLNPARTPGGSSGGAAASVGAGVVPAAIGSDAGGSVRIPAALSGLVGFKPTNALVPELSGVSSFPTLSVAGVIARTVPDVALVAAVACGLPSLAALEPAPPGSLSLAAALMIDDRPVDDDVAAQFHRSVSQLKAAGVPVAEVSPDSAPPGDLWFELATAECLIERHSEWQTRRDDLDPYTVELLAHASDSEPDLEGLARARVQAKSFLDLVLERAGARLLVTCAMECEAWAADHYWPESIGCCAQTSDAFGANLFLANLVGAPAISIPMGTGDEGLPVGLQVVGRPGDDEAVIAAALAFEALLADESKGG